MKTAIFIRTCAKDWAWLAHALASLRKYAHGHDEIVIAVPQNEYKKVRQSVDLRKCTVTECARHHEDDYIGQQVTKMKADVYCPGADHILFWDSDCVAYRNFNIAEFFNDAPDRKPLHNFRSWEGIGTSICWQQPTRDILGIEPAFEFMAQLPIIHSRLTLKRCREYIAAHHNAADPDALDVFAAIKDRKMSEFNLLGAFAHYFTPDEYDWRRAGPMDGYPRVAEQFWSWGGFTAEIEARIARYLA